VSLTRISNNSVISIESQNQVFLRATNEYQIGRLLCDQIAKRFSIEMPASEVCAITVLLVGAKYTTPQLYMKEDWVQVQILADRMIRMMSERLNIAFYEDEEIYSALQADLGPMVIRLKNKVPSLNPNLQQIKENYESIFSNLLEVVQNISSPLLAGIQEDDVAYLSLHFCASIERGKRSSTVSRVAIVCVHGVATANLLKEMVCSRFKIVRVVATTTENDLSSIQPADVDFVISSIPLINTKVPWIRVNPLLTPDDFNKIAKMIEKHFSKSETSTNYLDFFNDIVRTIENQCEVENMPHLIDSLKKCFDKASIQVKINKIQPSLAQLLPAEKIRCRVTVADWEDAVMQVGAILVNTGDVTPDYIQSIIEIVRNTGPYSVISKGIALVHGKVGSGVNGLSMSMITLKEPVIFHHPINDPVRLILCLAPVDDFSHVSALNDFIEFLRNYDLDRICKEEDPHVINEFLQRSYSLS
jgi:mannitol/fructose-specific phosphotransferase system IIA component (Ntr-type)/transcriptional regulatory protein LevR